MELALERPRIFAPEECRGIAKLAFIMNAGEIIGSGYGPRPEGAECLYKIKKDARGSMTRGWSVRFVTGEARKSGELFYSKQDEFNGLMNALSARNMTDLRGKRVSVWFYLDLNSNTVPSTFRAVGLSTPVQKERQMMNLRSTYLESWFDKLLRGMPYENEERCSLWSRELDDPFLDRVRRDERDVEKFPLKIFYTEKFRPNISYIEKFPTPQPPIFEKINLLKELD